MWGTHQQEAIEYGNVIHEILSLCKNKNDVDLAITKAIENGLINLKSKRIVVAKRIKEIVNHQRFTRLFFRSDIEVLNEQTIIQKEGKIIKPDRMVLTKNNEVHIVGL